MFASLPMVAFVPVGDLDRAERFYSGTLGLPVVERSAYAVVFSGGGTTLRATLVENPPAAGHTVLGWTVPDAAGAVRLLAQAGVTLQRYDGMGQDDDGIWTAPGGAKVAWFRDPDGNVLSVTQL